MFVTNERYDFEVYSRLKNSPYEWSEEADFNFKGRPASQQETKEYRIQKGVNGGTDSIFIIASNLPEEINVGDKVIYLGKEWMVKSIGYYFDSTRFVNPTILKNEYIINKCPKGINIG